MPPSTVTVGMLRPPLVAFINDSEEQDASRIIWGEQIMARLDDLREMFAEAADATGIECRVTDYQLHRVTRGVSLAKRPSARSLGKKDIIVTYDPTPAELEFASEHRTENPLQRTVLAYSDHQDLDDVLPMVASSRLPLVNNAREQYLQRIFALKLPLHQDAAAENFATNVSVLKRALRYPFMSQKNSIG